MDPRSTDEQRRPRHTVREFAKAATAPRATEWDLAQCMPIESPPRLVNLGPMGAQFPDCLGGAAMTISEGFVEVVPVLDADRIGTARQHLVLGA